MMRHWLFLALLVPQVALAQAGPLRELDAYIERAMRDWKVPGLALAVVKDDSVVFVRGYGVRAMGKPEPVDPNTLFAIASNTKLFTAVAAGMLVDEGRMQWDDPATRYLPSFQLFDPYVTREITLRDLLSHRSGLGRRGDVLWEAFPYDRAEVLRRIRFLAPNSSFRSAHGYQNIMFLAAGEAVAAAAGKSWDDLVRERIFQPLGMTRSNTTVRDLDAGDNVARPHVNSEEGRQTTVPYRNMDNIAPAGAINSSAREMAQWIKLLLADGRYGGRTLLKPATLREISSPQSLRPLEPDSVVPSIHFSAYGLGVGMHDYRGVKVLRHTGGIDGMLSLVGLIPEKGLGIVVLTNTSDHNNLFTALMYRVFDEYLGVPPRDWSSIFLAQTRAAQASTADQRRRLDAARVADARPSLPLAKYTGRYESPLYGEITVTHEKGGLVLRLGSLVGDLEHWHYDTFRPRWRALVARSEGAGEPPFVSFRLDVTGKVEKVQIDDVDEFRRTPDGPASGGR